MNSIIFVLPRSSFFFFYCFLKHILLLLHMPVISEEMVDMNGLYRSVSEVYFLPVETLEFALAGSQGLRTSVVLSRLILSLS